MNHERNAEHAAANAADPIDDRTLAALVRDVADEWRMPPQRLNAPTWRERVGRGRPGGLGHGWFGRLTGAASLAIVATVVLALVAVWLTLPRQQVSTGKTPAPSGPAATPRITPRPIATALPKLTVNGELPSVTSMLLRVGGDFAIADLRTGSLGSRITSTYGNSDMRRLPDGRLVCLCVDTDAVVNGAYTHAVVSLRTYDSSGAPTGSKPIGEFSGVPDPRPGVVEDQPPHVDVAVSFSPDDRLGFVGWSLRKPPVWQSGLIAVDLAAGKVVRRLDLPEVSTGPANAPVNVLGARVTFSPDGGHALVSRARYWIVRPSGAYHGQTDHFRAPASVETVDAKPALPAGHQCADAELDAGVGPNGSIWVLCWTDGGGSLILRRIGPDGAALGDTPVEAGGEGGVSTPTRDGTGLYLWSPQTRTISRIDLRTGDKTTGTAPAPSGSAGDDLLRAIGRWLAPAAAAKVFLQPGLVLSPDGSRLYALGVAPGTTNFIGSAGVYVFDAASLAVVDHWQPEADYVSLAVSGDGRFVYALGAPGVDAAGYQSGFGASMTVYDAADGSIRLQAGQLEHDDLQFVAPILP